MILKFDGPIQFGDSYRVDETEDALHGLVHIGGVDVLAAVAETRFSQPVTVALADERYSGSLAYEIGWGYSEWTPVEDDKLTVGPHNILKILARYNEGEVVTLWIADEPINTLDPPPVR